MTQDTPITQERTRVVGALCQEQGTGDQDKYIFSCAKLLNKY